MYISPGDSATASDAACAKLLFAPTTNVSKVYLGLRFGLIVLTDGTLFVCVVELCFVDKLLSSLGNTNLSSKALPITSSMATLRGTEYFFDTNSVPNWASLTSRIITLSFTE